MDLRATLGHLLRTGRNPPRLSGRLLAASTRVGSMDAPAADGSTDGQPVDDRPLFVLSTQGEATDGNIIRQFWDVSRVAGAGCPILWNHNPDGLLGQWEDVAVRDVDSAPALTARALFDPEDPCAQNRKRQVKARILRASSVGWKPGSMTRRGELDPSDPLYRKPIDGDCGPEEGYVMGSAEEPNVLIEASLTPVPADPGAVVTGRLYHAAEREVDGLLRGDPEVKIDALMAIVANNPRARAWVENLVVRTVRTELARNSSSDRTLSQLFRS